MKCPKCKFTSYRKNGHRSGKQNYLWKICGRQFLDSSSQISIENCNTTQVNHYSLAMETKILSFADFVHKIEELIQAEQKSTTECLSSLSTITTLFQERCNITNSSNKSLAIAQAQDEVVAIGVDFSQAIVEERNLKSNATSTTKNIESIEVL